MPDSMRMQVPADLGDVLVAGPLARVTTGRMADEGSRQLVWPEGEDSTGRKAADSALVCRGRLRPAAGGMAAALGIEIFKRP